MDVCGEGVHIDRSHLVQLAQQGGLDVRWAEQRLNAMLDVVDQWPLLIELFDIRRDTQRRLLQTVRAQREKLKR